MIPYENALNTILDNCPLLNAAYTPLDDTAGGVLAEDVVTPFPLPRFDNSEMDGYGIRAGDFVAATSERPIPLEWHQTITTGENPVGFALSGNAVRIMTGAHIPDGIDAVVKREDVETAGGLLISKPPRVGDHIRKRGGELPEGTRVLKAGTLVTPPVVGLLATLGMSRVKVRMPPKIGIIVTGDELVGEGASPAPGQIFDANGPALKAAAISFGCRDVEVAHCEDSQDAIRAQLEAAFIKADIVISVGGISVGDHDYIRRAAEAAGVEEIFWRVAVKPGKPLLFGKAEVEGKSRLLFGLPGNPVSALVEFLVFIKPAMRKMMGHSQPENRMEWAIVTETLNKTPIRLHFVRARTAVTDGGLQVTPVRGQESHMLSGLTGADCLMIFPREATELKAGDRVRIIKLDWGIN